MVKIEYDNRRTKALGLARTNSNTIVMCCKSMRNYSYADVYHTILHEIAHIMQYDKYRGKITNPHGTEFFEMCRIVGIPEIQYHETEKVLARATQRAIEFRIK
jgi:predicted SprT family Zn-dependent metalloprotease